MHLAKAGDESPTLRGGATRTTDDAAIVDVVVVSYNSGDRLRDTVSPLAAHPSTNVIVVDNASPDDTVSTISDLPLTAIELGENLGFGGGCNVGWRAGSAPYVLFLNPDARMSPDDILGLVEVAGVTAAGVVAPRIVDDFGNLEWSLRRFPEVRSIFGQALFAHRMLPAANWVDETIRDPAAYDHRRTCDWASGAALLVPRNVLDEIGGFDAGFFMYCEDVDLCRRVWDLGRKVVFEPSVVCVHAGGGSAPRWTLLPTLARSRVRYAQKHFGAARAAAYRTGVAVNALTHVVGGRSLRPRIGHARAFAAALQPGAGRSADRGIAGDAGARSDKGRRTASRSVA